MKALPLYIFVILDNWHAIEDTCGHASKQKKYLLVESSSKFLSSGHCANVSSGIFPLKRYFLFDIAYKSTEFTALVDIQ